MPGAGELVLGPAVVMTLLKLGPLGGASSIWSGRGSLKMSTHGARGDVRAWRSSAAVYKTGNRIMITTHPRVRLGTE